jgi:hypothetical protein
MHTCTYANRGNGEALVGRDVLPRIGMRVVMSRQALRWREEQVADPKEEKTISRRRIPTYVHTHTQGEIQRETGRARGGEGRKRESNKLD